MKDFPNNCWFKFMVEIKKALRSNCPKHAKTPDGCPMTHVRSNARETSHQTDLAGKQEGIRHFPSKMIDKLMNEARNKKDCCDEYGEETSQ